MKYGQKSSITSVFCTVKIEAGWQKARRMVLGAAWMVN